MKIQERARNESFLQKGFRYLKVAGLIALGAIGAFLGANYVNGFLYKRSAPETIRAKVTGIEIGTRDGRFVNIIRTDKETFLNFDEPLRNKFQDAVIDIQLSIHKDSTYDFTVYGTRNRIMPERFETYRNITDIQTVKKP